MRLAVLSDVHGNLAALDAVLADIEAGGPWDALGVAGDLCTWGPRPRATIDRIRALTCPVIQGNTDRDVTIEDPAVLRGQGKGEDAIAALAWTRDQIGIDGVAFLASLPLAHTFAGPDGHDVLMVHANTRDQDTHLRPDASPDEVARLTVGAPAVLVFGHLHIPYVRREAGRLLVDAASLGYPRDGDTRAAYACLEWRAGTWHAAIRRVAYDLEATARDFRACGMPRAERRIKQLYKASYRS